MRAVTTSTPAGAAHSGSRRRLRLLSYNIQAGLVTRRYRDYFTRGWQHLLPASGRAGVLARIAQALAAYDVVALQEIDAGSLRTGFVHQAHHLAELAGFPDWHHLVNRRMGRFAQHGIALLSRTRPTAIEEHRLPGLRGRGAVLARFGDDADALLVVSAHLALSRRGRLRQVAYLAALLGDAPHAVLMGDLNCEPGSPELELLCARTALGAPLAKQPTYPSWRPQRHIDHILATPGLALAPLGAPEAVDSDHLPVAAEILLPGPA